MADIILKMPAFDKLLDYVASGVGAIAGPLLAPWRASQEGKARVNTAKADVEVQRIKAAAESSTSQLIAKEQAEAKKYVATSDKPESDGDIIRLNDVQKAMEFQAKKRFMNVRALVGHAVEELGDTEVPDHDPDPDWTARFFDGAQDVSSEELQKLWGKILAGQIKSPGQTSLRTLSILRDMKQQEAKDFLNLMRFQIGEFIFIEPLQKMLNKYSDNLLFDFSDIGLLVASIRPVPIIIIKDNGTFILRYCGHALIIEGPAGQQIKELTANNTCVMTRAGLELAKLCQHEPDFQYLSHFARFLARHNCKLKLGKTIDQGVRNFRLSDIRVIEPFVELEEHNQKEPNDAE